MRRIFYEASTWKSILTIILMRNSGTKKIICPFSFPFRQPKFAFENMAFEHRREGAGTSHTDVNIAYKAWDNSNWMARIEGEGFWHFREGTPL
jgi:hypothetical protein